MKRILFILATSLLPASGFEIASVIHPAVANLNPPVFHENLTSSTLPISSSSPEAAKHVQQGIAILNTAWDFEAYRHFTTAAKLDPDCLMAFWGISMTLAGGDHDYQIQQAAAMDRLLDLLENGAGSELEKGLAYAAAKLQAEGLTAAVRAFTAVSEKFPADLTSKTWAAFLSRTGFDLNGNPRPGHEEALQALQDLVVANPDQSSLLCLWLMARAEMPNDQAQLFGKSLPMARKLVRLLPDFPPARHLLGHYEFRCGNAALAASQFQKSAELYQAYMDQNKVTLFDCEGWTKAKLYHAAALTSKGDDDDARPIFEKLASLQVTRPRLYSRGGSLIIWEARTAGARYQTGISETSDYDFGLKLLDALPAEQWHLKDTLAPTYQRALGLCLAARKALAKQDQKAARAIHRQLVETVGGLIAVQDTESRAPSASQYRRAVQTLAILTMELEGLIFLQDTGATRSAALTWFRSASERQTQSSLLMPPPLPDPLELRIATFQLEDNRPVEAAETCRATLTRYPNHLATLQLYLKTLNTLQQPEAAARVEERITQVKK